MLCPDYGKSKWGMKLNTVVCMVMLFEKIFVVFIISIYESVSQFNDSAKGGYLFHKQLEQFKKYLIRKSPCYQSHHKLKEEPSNIVMTDRKEKQQVGEFSDKVIYRWIGTLMWYSISVVKNTFVDDGYIELVKNNFW